MSGAGLKYCVVASLTTTNQTNLTTNELVPQIRVPAPHVVNVSHGVKRLILRKETKPILLFAWQVHIGTFWAPLAFGQFWSDGGRCGWVRDLLG